MIRRGTGAALGQQPDERGKHDAISPVQPGLGIGSAQHSNLMAQDEQLDILRRPRTGQPQPAQNPQEDQVQQTQRHKARSPCRAGRLVHPDHGYGRLLEPRRRQFLTAQAQSHPCGGLPARRHRLTQTAVRPHRSRAGIPPGPSAGSDGASDRCVDHPSRPQPPDRPRRPCHFPEVPAPGPRLPDSLQRSTPSLPPPASGSHQPTASAPGECHLVNA